MGSIVYANLRAMTTAAALGLGLMATAGLAEDAMMNSCPVDGCEVKIISVEKEDGELRVEFEANFAPSLSKNHLHVWWGELYDVRQVSANAETTYGMKQGDWHPTDSYPSYLTTSVVSVQNRGEATSLCVTAADRNHDILDPELYHCQSVADLL